MQLEGGLLCSGYCSDLVKLSLADQSMLGRGNSCYTNAHTRRFAQLFLLTHCVFIIIIIVYPDP